MDRKKLQKPGTGRRRVVQLNASLPPHLLTPRSITSLQEIHSSFWIGDMIPLLVSVDAPILPMLLQAGAAQTQIGAPVIRRGSQINFRAPDSVLPFVAKGTVVPSCGDSIPATSWGSNLRNLLIPDQWEKLRRSTFARTGGHCEICGFWKGLECHELWEYHEPAPGLPETVCGVQRLGSPHPSLHGVSRNMSSRVGRYPRQDTACCRATERI